MDDNLYEILGIILQEKWVKNNTNKTVKLTSIIVSHADVVTNHVRHRTCQQMRFVYVDVDTDANRPWCAYRLWHSYTCFTSSKRFAPTSKQQISEPYTKSVK